MATQRKQRMTIVSFIVVGSAIAVGLVLFALNEGINVFYTPSEVAQGEVPSGQNFRIGGMVKSGSLRSGELQGTEVQFMATDCLVDIPVSYTGVLPDLFREGQGVVADGYIDGNGVFQASQILAKHDENYMPAESVAAMEASGATCDP
ncbi:MAG: cytochrome c maturation protein CcmE [Gammaproteobacteria bacterium]|nr:cytochrome c maturation protein CcmE [Gammaproteobacteria bacterium]MAY02770.1 cytochrome c maturation protein CcmE [Gammaproteobacteria bacterium]|tara:strand:- start:799 stop:1242 length:444 start_codon:yes stop_codon:yes gene_type:complete